MARRRRRHRRKGRFAVLYKLMTFLLICGALVAALALFFKVESIEITGTSRYSTDEVERASGVHVGDNLYLMDKNAVASHITQQLPYVETVKISRRLPKTLCISVTECRGLAAIEQDGRLWLISEGGKLVDTAPADDAAQYAVVTGLTLESPELGRHFTASADCERAGELLGTLLHELRSKDMLTDVSAIHLEDASAVTIRYLDRFDVEFLWDADFDYKLNYLAAVVQELEANEKGTILMTHEGEARFIPG